MAPTAIYCEDDLRKLPALKMELTSGVDLEGGATIPAGTAVTVSIREKRSPVGAQPMFVKLEATSIHWVEADVSVRTREVPVFMERPSGTGKIVRGAALGGFAGAGIALMLKKNVLAGAAVGAVAGAGVGAAVASRDEACVVIEGTRLGFAVTRDVTLNR